MVGTDKKKIHAGIEAALEKKQLPEKSPFGDGHAAEKIAETVKKEFASG